MALEVMFRATLMMAERNGNMPILHRTDDHANNPGVGYDA